MGRCTTEHRSESMEKINRLALLTHPRWLRERRVAMQAGCPPIKLNFLDQLPKDYKPKMKKERKKTKNLFVTHKLRAHSQEKKINKEDDEDDDDQSSIGMPTAPTTSTSTSSSTSSSSSEKNTDKNIAVTAAKSEGKEMKERERRKRHEAKRKLKNAAIKAGT